MRSPTFLVVLLLIAPRILVAQPRTDQVIKSGWKFTRENVKGGESATTADAHWENISLPHTWNARDGQDGGNDFYRGVGWYRNRLTLDHRHRGKGIFLKFDGVSSKASVYVNGTLAGTHRGSFGAFCFDVSSLVTFDAPNLIAVQVTNARDSAIAPLRGDFTIFGGIYRDVHLLVLNSVSVSPLDYASPGVYIRQHAVTADRADLEITTVVRNGGTSPSDAVVQCTVRDREGKNVAAARSSVRIDGKSSGNHLQSLSVPSPRLWDGRKDPYMYDLVVEVLEGRQLKDRVVQSLGLRNFEVDAERGFILNGRPYRLHGVNRHQDRQDLGWAIGLKEHQEDFQLIKEIGATAVRLAHYQQAGEFYDLCDRGGMVVWAELGLVDEIHPSPEFASCTEDQLVELIKQNFNHPSIMCWSIFNELMPDGDREMYGRLVARLNATAKRLDPGRLTVMASRSKYGVDEQINTVTDLVGYNVYRGWYDGKPEDFGAFADGLRQRAPGRRFCISEYGAGAAITQHENPPRRPYTKGPWHPEEWQSVLHEVTWKAIAQRPFLWGSFVWNMFDFASDGRSEGVSLGINDKGLVTFDRRTKKDAFFWYKANWNDDPMVHITSKRQKAWPAGRSTVKLYANCDSVALTVNGEHLGTKTSPDRIYLWEGVDLVKGANRIEAVGFKGGKRIQDSCVRDVPAGTSVTDSR